MAWPEKLKLSKQLIKSVTTAGYAGPKDIQQKTLARIYGGQDVIAIGPEGCGKTTTYVLAVLNRLKYNPEGVPLVLVLAPDKDAVLAVSEKFESLNPNKSAKIVGLYAAPGIESQMNALADGADVVVATPDRARAIYLKLGLNLNKIELLIIDDADLIVKQGLQLPVAELANSIGKCQHLVFTEVMHKRLHKMISPFMETATVVEVEETAENQIETLPQVIYHVPNFITKLNLLNLFMQDAELFTKTIVFVNTRHTAETLYKNLQNGLKNTVGVLNPWSVELKGFTGVSGFRESDAARILIIVNEDGDAYVTYGSPFLLHFELPADKELFINRIKKGPGDIDEETLSITFVTDLELSLLKKIEQLTGQKMPFAELPKELVIEKDKKDTPPEEKKPAKSKTVVPVPGEAFHQKKASNAKTTNYSSGTKAKMDNKRKH